MKKLISVVLTLSLIFGVVLGLGVTANALSDSGKCGENVTYTFNSNTGTLTISGTGDMYNYKLYSLNESPFSEQSQITITTVIINNGVTSIGNSAFEMCNGLTAVTIPESVTRIGNRAFSDCYDLESINIPESITSIGVNAFLYTDCYYNKSNWENDVLYIDHALIKAKKSISGEYDIKSGTTCIAASAFYDCSGLTSVTIPDSITSISSYAFDGCRALSIKIPDSVTSICDWAFDECYSLTDVYYAGTKEEWNNILISYYRNGCLTDATIHFNSTGSGGDGIKYTVSPLANTGGTVYVYNGSELVSSADSADGTFTLDGVGAGTYDVYVTCKFGVLTKVAMALNVDGTELEPVEDVYIPIGDVNTDGLIDVSDISSILLDGIYATANEDYDIDSSGAVDINDVSTVLLETNYGASAATIG